MFAFCRMTMMRGAASVLRRLAVLVAAGLVLAVPAAAAQTEPARLAVTATSDHCAGGLPVVDYSVASNWSAPGAVQVWWVADASVYGSAGTHNLEPAPASEDGSFELPFAFYSTVTVYATAVWPDGQVTTNASWAIPVADCAAQSPTTTTIAEPEPPTTTTIPEDEGHGNGNGNGNGNGGIGRG
jgi:hypothetical protein